MQQNRSPEFSALHRIRRGALIFLCTFSLLLSAIRVPWDQISTASRVALGLAAACVPLSLWKRRVQTGEATAVVALLLFVSAGLWSTTVDPWLPVAIAMPPITYVVATLNTRPLFGWLSWIAPGTTALLHWARPDAYIGASLHVWFGIPQFLMVAVAGLMTNWAWRLSVHEALDSDRFAAEALEMAEELESARERQLLWTATGQQLHDTVLNLNRYLLGVAQPDATKLRNELSELATDPLPETIQRDDTAIRQFTSPDAIFAKGRLLITAPLVGQILVLSLYVAAAEPIASVFWVPAAISIVGTVAVAWRYFSRKQVAALPALLLAVTSLAYPASMFFNPNVCLHSDARAMTLMLAGYAGLTVATWTTIRLGVLIGLVNTILILATYFSIDQSCRTDFQIAPLRVGALMGPMLAGAFLSSRTMARATNRNAQLAISYAASISRLQALEERTKRIGQSVVEILEIYRKAAASAELSGIQRKRIQCLDAQLRAAIQVGKGSGGAFPDFALSLISTATQQNLPVDVRGLSGSADSRPIPEQVTELCTEILKLPQATPPTISTFTDGHSDFLAISATNAQQMVQKWNQTSFGHAIEVTCETDDHGRPDVVVISRLLPAGQRRNTSR